MLRWKSKRTFDRHCIVVFNVILCTIITISHGSDPHATCPETAHRPVSLKSCENCKNPEGCPCGNGIFTYPTSAEEESKEKAKLITPGAQGTAVFNDGEESPFSEQEFPVNDAVFLHGGNFTMGSNKVILLHMNDGEGPERKVYVDDFYMDRFEVSNGEFRKFVEDTNHKTEAETFGNSFAMEYFLSKKVNDDIDKSVQAAPWWLPVPGANWKHPEGKGSHIKDRMDHPVLHVSWNDATAFCDWKGGSLPTEAQWEFACRGGKEKRMYPWGNKDYPNKEIRMNIWTGKFPVENNASDGYAGTAPVNKFPQNNYGLHNIVGNVWEWTKDWFTAEHSDRYQKNPTGPPTGTSKVKKGGSFMCIKNHCFRYRCSARSHVSADTSAYNVGFRCVYPSTKKSSNHESKEEL